MPGHTEQCGGVVHLLDQATGRGVCGALIVYPPDLMTDRDFEVTCLACHDVVAQRRTH